MIVHVQNWYMNLNRIDLFSQYNPCRILDFRALTAEEAAARPWDPVERIHGIRDKLIKTISNPIEAVAETIDGAYFRDIETYVKELSASPLSVWRQSMPSKTPRALVVRRNAYGRRDDEAVRVEIENFGALPPCGQVVYHAGNLPQGKAIKLNRPLSTSLSPVVAWLDSLRNVSKSTSATLAVYVLTVFNPTTKMFVYDHKSSNLGHELEVLFNTGAVIDNQSVVMEMRKNLTVNPISGEKSEFVIRIIAATIS